MPISIEARLGIPQQEPFVAYKFEANDPLAVETAKVTCDVFNLDADVFYDEMLAYVVRSLNQEKGHPARVLFLKIIFQTIGGYVQESEAEKWHH